MSDRKEYKRRYREQNREKIKAYNDSRRETMRDYYQNNKERLKDYQKTNRERFQLQRKQTLETDMLRRMKYLVNARRSEARKRDLPFELTPEIMVAFLILQNYSCALTGIPFDLSFSDEYRSAPHSPSIDRKDSTKGYTFDNVQLVCFSVNAAKGQYPIETFDAMCRARVAKLGNA